MSTGNGDTASVIVTTRNSAATLPACLASIRQQSYDHIELIVVDNHSTDLTLEIAHGFADQVLTLGPERSAQRNRGAVVATGEYLVFIDSDMVLETGVVADAVATLRRSGLPAVIIPEVTIGQGFWTRCRALERSCYQGDDTVEAARVYRRGVFFEVGGFDTALNGGEDWDLSRRVARGHRLIRTRSLIRHDEGQTRLLAVYKKRRYYAAGYLDYLRKHRRGALAQGMPLLRTAYIRNWRRLVRHPALSAGMFVLKFIELAAVLQVAVTQTIRGRRAQGAP